MQPLSTTVMKSNADRIVELADLFGHLPADDGSGRSIEAILNLCIPLARLIKTGLVLAVQDSADGVNDQAVTEVEEYCRRAIQYLGEQGSQVYEDWKAQATIAGLYDPALLNQDENVKEEIDWYDYEPQLIKIPGARRNVQSAVQPAWAAKVRRQAKRFGVKVSVSITASQAVAIVRVTETQS